MSRGDESVSHGLTVIMRDFNSHSKWVLHCYIQKQRFISFFLAFFYFQTDSTKKCQQFSVIFSKHKQYFF